MKPVKNNLLKFLTSGIHVSAEVRSNWLTLVWLDFTILKKGKKTVADKANEKKQ